MEKKEPSEDERKTWKNEPREKKSEESVVKEGSKKIIEDHFVCVRARV